MKTANASAPDFRTLRPMRDPVGAGFPVYHDLVETLARTEKQPDDEIAHALAVCAGYAYADETVVSTMMARLGLDGNLCRKVEENVDAMFICSTAYLVQSADGRVVVLAYRGTRPADFVNWLTDADVHPREVAFPLPHARACFEVHGGFYRNVRATRYAVVGALQRALDGKPVYRVADDPGDERTLAHRLEALYVTGHSLGAAMAALMTVMLRTDPAYVETFDGILRGAYTFGQPMLGTPEFAARCQEDDFLRDNVVRYVFGRDVVAAVPPELSGRFAHFGREFRCRTDGPPNWTESRTPVSQMRNILDFVGAPMSFAVQQVPMLRHLPPLRYSFYDHGPQNYIDALTPPGVLTEFGC